MFSFSLIIPTINRTQELEKLLRSIKNLKYNNIKEVIVVDQNKTELIDEIIKKYTNVLPLKHCKVDFKGAARARNYGAKFATGEILNFPDDDSKFLEHTLTIVDDYFNKYPEYSIICGKIEDNKSQVNILKFKSKDTKVRFSNLYNTTIECGLFIKREEFFKIGMFDNNLGIGTYYGAEEGADLVCRFLYEHKKIMYTAKTLFYHPNKKCEENMEKYYRYGLGTGRLAKKHIKVYKSIIPVVYLLLKDVKSICLLIKSFLCRNKQMVNKNLNLIKGRHKGFFSKKEEDKKWM